MKISSWPRGCTLAKQLESSLLSQRASFSSSTSGAIYRASRRKPTPSQHQPFTFQVARRPFTHQTCLRQYPKNAADDPNFTSILDTPAELVRVRRRHGPGLIILALIPLTALALGTWQVQRLQWKSKLIAKLEDRLVREPLPLPPRIDPDAIHEFDYRRVLARGTFRHDQEMLVGPRMRDGEDGYMVVTPMERGGGSDAKGTATVLVNRGWIGKKFCRQQDRPEGLPQGEVMVEGLLREPWKKNMFTPDNRPDKGEFYFPDVKQMAALSGSQAVWVEQTMEPEFMQALEMVNKGIPVGRAPEVNLRNTHAQYIFTWYGLALATSIMFYMVVKKPPTDISRRVRMSKEWT